MCRCRVQSRIARSLAARPDSFAQRLVRPHTCLIVSCPHCDTWTAVLGLRVAEQWRAWWLRLLDRALFAEFGPNSVELGPILGDHGPMLFDTDLFLADVGRPRPQIRWNLVGLGPNLVEVGATSAEFGPMLLSPGQSCPIPRKCWSKLAELGPDIGRHRPQFCRFRAQLGNVGRSCLKTSRPTSTEFGRSRSQVGRIRPGLGHISEELDRIWSDLGKKRASNIGGRKMSAREWWLWQVGGTSLFGHRASASGPASFVVLACILS